jgi:hypothetical protein
MFGRGCAFVQAPPDKSGHSPRMSTRKPLVIVVALALVPGAAALVRSAAPVVDDAPAPRFGWLAGHWCAQHGGELLEEFWLPPAGDLALGMGRTLKDGVTTSHEFLRIETRNGGTRLTAIHNGQSPTAFELTASGPKWARFENPQHDFPTRIEYRRTSAGLHAQIAGPDQNGGEATIPFDYRRCAD